jgi:hypothetical protein
LIDFIMRLTSICQAAFESRLGHRRRVLVHDALKLIEKSAIARHSRDRDPSSQFGTFLHLSGLGSYHDHTV